MLSKDKLIELINDNDLSDDKDLILQHAKPAIHIQREYVADDSTIPIGASKMGGKPDLPEDFEWQYFNNLPLTFLFQVKLSDVAPYDVDGVLPKTGWLYFFYEVTAIAFGQHDQQGGALTYYVADENTPLKRTLHPTGQGEWMPIKALPAFRLAFSEMWIPSMSDGFWDQMGEIEQDEPYSLLIEWIEQNYYPLHTMLGHPFQIQGDPQAEAQVWSHTPQYPDLNYSDLYDKVKDGTADWRLLLQVDSDYVDEANMDLMFGDAGRLYFMIREHDLQARSFDKVWQIMQCS